ncbi:MAG: ribonuclease E/G, partial [Acinetobacter sp.]
ATLIVAANPEVQEKKPVTRDVAITKAAHEAQPAEMLDLTPPKAVNDLRVANDPRERRRLAKQAAVQAKQEHQAELENHQAQAQPVVEATNESEAEGSVESTVTEAPTETVILDTATQTTAEVQEAAVETVEVKETVAVVEAQPEVEVQSEAPSSNQSEETQQSLALDTAPKEKASNKDEPEVSTDEKPARPRRPRGRPPKKTTPPTAE